MPKFRGPEIGGRTTTEREIGAVDIRGNGCRIAGANINSCHLVPLPSP